MSRARQQWGDFVRRGGKSAGGGVPSVPLVAKRGFRGTVLGLDPSLRGTGIALLDTNNPEAMVLVASRVLRLDRRLTMPECLARIQEGVEEMLEQHPVDHVAVEQAIYVQNLKTALTLGSARGALLAPVARRGIPITEYPPLRIKQAVVGYGRASKEQMIRSLQQWLRLGDPLTSDESDAAGAALCHALTALPLS